MVGILKYIYNCWIKNPKFNMRKFYAHSGIEAHEHGDLVLFKYKRDYWYEVNWNPKLDWDPLSRAARGIIFNRKTGELLAKPYDKFFNIGQVPETELRNLPNQPSFFSTTEKKDGWLGISYWHEGELKIASSGSLDSEVAKWATAWANMNLKVDEFIPGYTYIFEMIHPDFKIVVDYGEEKKLVLTGVIHTETNKEISYEQLMHFGNRIDCEVTPFCFFKSIEDIIEECENLPHNEEGYVVTYPNGLKIKIKGKEYTRLHKMISDLTPLTFWRAWDLKTRMVPRDLVKDMPDEFKAEVDKLYEETDKVHNDYANRIRDLYKNIIKDLGEDVPPQVFYPYIKKNYYVENAMLMSLHRNNEDKFWYHIHKRVRPSENAWPDINEI